MVFFPSYKFMEDVLEVYENEFSAEWVRCISQTSGMNEREKEEFLEEFSASEGTLVVLLVVVVVVFVVEAVVVLLVVLDVVTTSEYDGSS